jgi:hypothetical protein
VRDIPIKTLPSGGLLQSFVMPSQKAVAIGHKIDAIASILQRKLTDDSQCLFFSAAEMVNTAIRIIQPHIQTGRNGGKGHGPNRDAAIRKNSPLNSICASGGRSQLFYRIIGE